MSTTTYTMQVENYTEEIVPIEPISPVALQPKEKREIAGLDIDGLSVPDTDWRLAIAGGKVTFYLRPE